MSIPVKSVALSAPSPSLFPPVVRWTAVGLAAVTVVGVLIWQGLTSSGSPDPTTDGISHASAILDTGVLVFREGLEAILVLAALTAGLNRTQKGYWKPVALGASVSFLASIATWFVAVALVSWLSGPSDSSDPSPAALHVQAATGLLAIIVLLVVMNWFFHKIYWTGWITHHNRRKKALIEGSDTARLAMFWGLATIGFTSIYREGFEVVLFLQSIRLRVGSHVVLEGVLIGLALTSLVAMLTFVAQYKLPYKKMLVFTGIMLGAVLLVMVGEQVQEMQLAGWLPTHTLHNPANGQDLKWPDWLNVWFGIFPTIESLASQAFAAVLVIGSYFLARRVCVNKKSGPLSAEKACIIPDCAQCDLPHEERRTEQSPTVHQVTVQQPGR